jgi:hypothetical protein
MGTVTLPNTSKTVSDANLFANVKDNDQAIIDQVNGNLSAANLASNSVTTAKITDANVTTAKLADANVTDAKLASPNNSAYKTIARSPATIWGGITVANGTRYAALDDVTHTVLPIGTGNATITGNAHPPGAIYLRAADYAVAGLTAKLRVSQAVIVGSTSPSTVTLNADLRPLTISAGAVTIGSAVSSSGTTTSGLSTNNIFPFVSSDFSFPTDGWYVPCVTVGSITCPGGIAISLDLQTRNV